MLDTIERYLNGTMTNDEHSMFEEQLTNNPDLKQQVEDIRLILFGVRKAVLKSKLNAFHEGIKKTHAEEKKETKVRTLYYKRFAVAASVALVIGSFWLMNRTPRNEKLFSKHFTPDHGLVTTMSETKNYSFDDAMVNYKHGDYDLAIDKWKVLLQEKPANDTLNYFIGVTYLAKGDENSAIPLLTMVKNTKESIFTNETFYYLGLAYLKANNLEAAKNNLSKSNTDKSKTIISELIE